MTASTTEKGNAFRDIIAEFMRAAGYYVETEVNIDGKNVDVLARKKVQFREERIGIEAKDYDGNLPVDKANAFVFEYGNLVRNGKLSLGLLVTRQDVTPQGRLPIQNTQGLKHLTWTNLQSEIFRAEQYLQAVQREFRESGVEHYYIPPRTSRGRLLHEDVADWMSGSNANPLVILGGYGTGKSTFSHWLTNELANQYENDPSARIPIRVPLGEISDETSLEGLFGKLLNARYRCEGYHYDVFRELNRQGRFVVILDGLDEMKHGMTFPVFQRECSRLLGLAEGNARVILLGRPNVFPSEREFKSVIKGLETTASGTEIEIPGRSRCIDVTIAGFTLNDARTFVENYFRWLASGRDAATEWIDQRLKTMLDQKYENLILRPVHAQMLCQIATERENSLDDIDEFTLYDKFVTHLLSREIEKKGRYPGFGIEHRRRFNAAVSWWLMTHGGASTTTIEDVPDDLFRGAVHDVSHHFDLIGLKQELIAGCLVEKVGGTVYFGHRSIQEFLAAEHLYRSRFLADSGRLNLNNVVLQVSNHASPEVAYFLAEFLRRTPNGPEVAAYAVDLISDFRGNLEPRSVLPFVLSYRGISYSRSGISPWLFLVDSYSQCPGEAWTLEKQRHYFSRIASKATDRELWLAALQQVCIEASTNPDFPFGAFLGVIIESSSILERVQEAQVIKQRRLVQSVMVHSDDYRTFCLVSALKEVRSGENLKIHFDFVRAHMNAQRLLGYGPAFSIGDLATLEVGSWAINLNDVLEPLSHLPGNEMERLRMYLSDSKLFALIKPLEVSRKESARATDQRKAGTPTKRVPHR